MSAAQPGRNSLLETRPIRPKTASTHEPYSPSTPLYKKPRRTLNLDKCDHCRQAKKKCIPQLPSCQRCLDRGLQCPGLTRAGESAQAETVTTPSLIANTSSSQKLEQLKIKSCLACLALDLPCTNYPGERFCQACLYAERDDILRFRLCIRAAPFEDISIFLSCIPNDKVLQSLWARASDIDFNGISSEFDDTWTSSKIIDEVVGFLRPASIELTSKVGMLCSPMFVRMIQSHIPKQTALLFQRMLYGSSFSYVHPEQAKYTDKESIPMLQLLGAHAGHQVLRYLDRELSTQQLSTAGFEKRQTLFFLVFGAILAIRYSRRTSLSQEFTSDNPTSEVLWDKMREHLSEMLAHHLVLLGGYVGIWFNKDEEKLVLRSPHETWGRTGSYKWTKVDEQSSSSPSSDHGLFSPYESSFSCVSSTSGHSKSGSGIYTGLWCTKAEARVHALPRTVRINAIVPGQERTITVPTARRDRAVWRRLR